MRSRLSSGTAGDTKLPLGALGTWCSSGCGGWTWSPTCGSPPCTGSTRTWTSFAPSWYGSPVLASATAGKPFGQARRGRSGAKRDWEGGRAILGGKIGGRRCEERRVGEEGRVRGAPHHYKK